MQIFEPIVEYLKHLATITPVNYFVIIGAFIEEVIAPIPSPFIMTISGTLAESQGKPLIYLLWLAILGSVGKTLGALILYYIANKAEHIILGRFGKFFGVSSSQVEKLGAKLGKGLKDDLLLFGLRCLPVAPSSVISIACGVIRLNLKSYIIATFTGTTVRNLIFLYFGYSSISTYESLINGLEKTEAILQIVLLGLIGMLIGWSYLKRHRAQNSVNQ